jgi:hypothetical protein
MPTVPPVVPRRLLSARPVLPKSPWNEGTMATARRYQQEGICGVDLRQEGQPRSRKSLGTSNRREAEARLVADFAPAWPRRAVLAHSLLKTTTASGGSVMTID